VNTISILATLSDDSNFELDDDDDLDANYTWQPNNVKYIGSSDNSDSDDDDFREIENIPVVSTMD